MQTFILLLTVIVGDPETGPVHTFVLDSGMSFEDCMADKHDARHIWLGNNNIGMSCEEEVE